MTATKKITADPAPVNLDQPSPELVRWEELADRDTDIVHHGNAEKVLPFPRPAWADPSEDGTGRSHLSTCYSSPPASVPATHSLGVDHGDWYEPARAIVSAKAWGSGRTCVNLTVSKVEDGSGWSNTALSLQPSEATELARVLLAAVDLIGGTA